MRSITKEYEISADIDQVFEALTEPLNIRQWSGDEAVMEKFEGGSFSLWSGSIQGKNVEVGKHRIVQSWKEKNWKNFSKVEFLLTEKNGKTLLRMTHEQIPDQSYESMNLGWDKYYLGPLISFVET